MNLPSVTKRKQTERFQLPPLTIFRARHVHAHTTTQLSKTVVQQMELVYDFIRIKTILSHYLEHHYFQTL